MSNSNGFKAPDYTGNLTKYNPQTNKWEPVGIVNLWEQHPDKSTEEGKRKPDLSGKAYIGTVTYDKQYDHWTVKEPTETLNIAYWKTKP